MAKKKEDKPEPSSVLYYFYTEERWNNWINRLNEADFEGDPESEEMPEGLASLDNFTKDINVSVMKIIKLFQNGSFDKETALKKLEEVENIIMGDIPDCEAADIIQGLQMRFLVLFMSCKRYIEGERPEGEIKDLVKEGRKMKEDDIEKILELAAVLGIKVINGEKCCSKYLKGSDDEEPSLFDEWMGEVDELGEALKSLEKFEEEFGIDV